MVKLPEGTVRIPMKKWGNYPCERQIYQWISPKSLNQPMMCDCLGARVTPLTAVCLKIGYPPFQCMEKPRFPLQMAMNWG